MTDFNEYTMIQPEPLEEFIGFTEQEVWGFCAGSSLAFVDVPKWYDEYVLGSEKHTEARLIRNSDQLLEVTLDRG